MGGQKEADVSSNCSASSTLKAHLAKTRTGINRRQLIYTANVYYWYKINQSALLKIDILVMEVAKASRNLNLTEVNQPYSSCVDAIAEYPPSKHAFRIVENLVYF